MTLAFFDLIILHMDPDVNQRPRIRKNGVWTEKGGESALHIIAAKCGNDNTEFVLQVLDRIIALKPDLHALSCYNK